MPQVSKLPLNRDVQKEIKEALWWILAQLKTQDEIGRFLEDLLTSTEKTMLTKRLAVALLLARGADYKMVMEILKISKGTVWAMKKFLEKSGDGYKMVIKKLIKKEEMEKFWDNIDKIAKKLLGPQTKKDWGKYAMGDWWK